MRKLLLLFIFSISFCAHSQTVEKKLAAKKNPYTSSINAKFQQLDKTEITTDILYERVFPMADLANFNQTAADTSNVDHYYSAYAELQTADYNNRWGTITTLKNTVTSQAENQIPIGFINVDFEVLDKYALEDNLLDISTTDSVLIDVPNRPRSPYIKKNAIVASPLLWETHSKTVTFLTNSIYNMKAASKTINTIQIDFRNGRGIKLYQLVAVR